MKRTENGALFFFFFIETQVAERKEAGVPFFQEIKNKAPFLFFQEHPKKETKENYVLPFFAQKLGYQQILVPRLFSFFFVSNEISFWKQTNKRFPEWTSHGCQSFSLPKAKLQIFYFDYFLPLGEQLCLSNFNFKNSKQSPNTTKSTTTSCCYCLAEKNLVFNFEVKVWFSSKQNVIRCKRTSFEVKVTTPSTLASN